MKKFENRKKFFKVIIIILITLNLLQKKNKDKKFEN